MGRHGRFGRPATLGLSQCRVSACASSPVSALVLAILVAASRFWFVLFEFLSLFKFSAGRLCTIHYKAARPGARCTRILQPLRFGPRGPFRLGRFLLLIFFTPPLAYSLGPTPPHALCQERHGDDVQCALLFREFWERVPTRLVRTRRHLFRRPPRPCAGVGDLAPSTHSKALHPPQSLFC